MERLNVAIIHLMFADKNGKWLWISVFFRCRIWQRARV